MNRQGRVLVVEDTKNWQLIVSKTLEQGGFDVDKASTVEDALHALQNQFYHLLILDIGLSNVDDNDQSGMGLLQHIREIDPNGAMKIFMLSGRDSPENIRHSFRKFQVQDFYSKQGFDYEEFLADILQYFREEMQINHNLTIHWEGDRSPENLVVNMEVSGGQRVQRGSPLQERLAVELDDLLCRLFYRADSILVRALTEGGSGGKVLWVQPFLPSGGAQDLVVKIGDYHKINTEYHNFKEYIQQYVGKGRSTTVIELGYTPSLGGIAYSLVGANGEQMENFAAFYRRASIEEIRALLDNLFFDTCANWYASPGHLQPVDLAKSYQAALDFSTQKLENALDRLRKTVHGKDKLYFRALGEEHGYTNPIPAVTERGFVRPTYICFTHGDFNAQNILVDQSRQSWLIDFYRTGPGHILRDVAQLDTVVRFQLLGEEDASLKERLELEQELLKARQFRDLDALERAYQPANPAIARAFATTVHLRRIGHQLTAQNRRDDFQDYAIALLFYSVNAIRFSSTLRAVQREHALLAGSLLADCLGMGG